MEHPFLRSEMLWGPAAQRRLSQCHVILFGLGGVGSYAAECLARSGVGELTIVDSDTVALTNLNRQLEALHSTLGQPKAEAVAARLRDINPDLRLHPIHGLYDAVHRDTPSSPRAAGTTISRMPSIWSPASWIWRRRLCVWGSP